MGIGLYIEVSVSVNVGQLLYNLPVAQCRDGSSVTK